MLTDRQGHLTSLLSLVFVALLAGILLFFSARFLYELQKARILRYLSSLPGFLSFLANGPFDLLWKLLPHRLKLAVSERLESVRILVKPGYVYGVKLSEIAA